MSTHNICFLGEIRNVFFFVFFFLLSNYLSLFKFLSPREVGD